MNISMIPNRDVKTIHASQNDTNRKWVFEPFDNNGYIKPSEHEAVLELIKGNTIVWNQLVQNGNFVDSSNWTAGGGTVAISSNKATITFTSNGDRPFYQTISNKVEGNKVLVIFRAKASVNSTLNVYWGTTLKANISLTTTETEYSFISTVGSGNTNFNFSIFNAVAGDSVTYSNINLFDLTMMFGSGNEPSTVEEFTKLFPLPYYSYDSGSLLSFNGTGIKTTGKNLCIRTNENSNIYNADNLIPVKQGDEIWVYADYSTTGSDMWVAIYTLPTETNKNNYIVILGYVERGSVKKFTVTEDGYFGIAYGSGVSTYTINKMMIARTSFTVDDYEPYTSSYTDFGIAGKNIAYLEQGTLNFNSDGTEASSNTRVRTGFIRVEKDVDYIASSENNGWKIKNGCCYDVNFNFLGYNIYPNASTGRFYSSMFANNEWKSGTAYVRFIYGNSTNTNCTPSDYWYQFERGTSATSYEPYFNYFPTGMKSAGSVYDELTSTSAIQRIERANLGSLTWTKGNATTDGTGYVFYSQADSLSNSTKGNNIICASFLKSDVKVSWESVSLGYIFEATNGRIIAGGSSSYADGSAFKTAMNGVYLYYELDTPVETPISPSLDMSYDIENGGTEQLLPENSATPITTPLLADISYPDGIRQNEYFDYRAISFTMSENSFSLVCKGNEINCTVEDGKYAATSTASITNEPGFFPCKLKMIDKNGGVTYSQTFNLHVEKQP